MSDSFAGRSRFTVGGVINASVAVLMRNITTFVAITAIIGIPYIAIFVYFFSQMPQLTPGVHYTEPLTPALAITGGLLVIITGLTYVVAQAAINYGTFSDLRRQKTGLAECLRRGLVVLPTVIGAYILVAIGATAVTGAVFALSFIAAPVGFILFPIAAIAGIMFFLMWWVLIPTIVVEKAGIMASFGRARELTSGHRWKILGLLLIVWIAQSLVDWLTGMVAGVFGFSLSLFTSVLVTVLFMAFAGVLSAVGYYYLRAEKEGIAIDDIVGVFD
jgi:hypothetical protein